MDYMIGFDFPHKLSGYRFYPLNVFPDPDAFLSLLAAIIAMGCMIRPCQCDLALAPQIFGSLLNVHHFPSPAEKKGVHMCSRRTLFSILSHLDDQLCLWASTSRLINAILEEKDSHSDHFGVAFFTIVPISKTYA